MRCLYMLSVHWLSLMLSNIRLVMNSCINNKSCLIIFLINSSTNTNLFYLLQEIQEHTKIVTNLVISESGDRLHNCSIDQLQR